MKLGPLTIERASREDNGKYVDITLSDGSQAIMLKDHFDAVVVSKMLDSSSPDLREYGASGMSNYAGYVLADYNPELVGQRGIQNYDEMRKGSAQVRSSLRIVKAPLLGAQWYVAPGDKSDVAKRQAKFIEWALRNMSKTFIQWLSESFSFLDFGFYTFEKVFVYTQWEGRTVVKWKKFGSRPPRTLIRWEFDKEGGVQGMWHNRSPFGYDPILLPIAKVLLFNFDEEGGNPEGISILRSAYTHHYMMMALYKIDAIQKERHGIGVPYAKLPPNPKDSDKKIAKELVTNLRTNEKAGAVIPNNVEIGFFAPNTLAVHPLESAMHHEWMISLNVLAQFLNIGTSSGHSSGMSSGSGSRMTANSHAEIFIKSIRYMADLHRGVLNKWAIPELINYNFRGVTKYPELRVRRLGENADWRTLSVAIKNLVDSGLITPTPELEEWMLDYMDFPDASPDALAITAKERIAEFTKSVSSGYTDGP